MTTSTETSFVVSGDLEERIRHLGEEFYQKIRSHKVGILDPDFYAGKLMNWAMEDEEFRVSLFRFVDVLPSLSSSAEVIEHVQEYFKPVSHRVPGLLQWGLDIRPNSLTAKATALMVRRQVASMGNKFILGETPKGSLKSLRKIRQAGLAFTVDLLGEACVSEKESETYLQRYLELIDVLADAAPGWKESGPLVSGHQGEETVVNVSVKLSALYSQSKPVAHGHTVDVLADRLATICRKARERNAFVYVDMEDTSKTDITLETVKRVLGSEEFRDWDQAGFVLQAYLKRTYDDTFTLIQWLRARGTRAAVRLVKGAYWDTETILAKLANWPIPVWQEKPASDFEYERISRLLLDSTDAVYPAFGSHNIRSLCHAIEYARSVGLDRTDYELQALYGMAEPIKSAFASEGYLVRDYAPIGELLPGMAYLVRRLLENTSNEGFIRQGFHEGETVDNLLKAPQPEDQDSERAHLQTPVRESYTNAPLIDFSIPAEREKVADEIARLLERDRNDYPRLFPIINGEPLKQCQRFDNSVIPEDCERVLARIGAANPTQTAKAIDSLNDAFPAWRDKPVSERADVLFRAAEIMESRRAELTALMIIECGKPWLEADADVAEAIDFCNYYAHQALRMFDPQELCPLPGETDTYFYEPRGVCGVIAPWNFPSAIPTGMFAAALVTGNTVALKPAEQAPVIAERVFRIFLEAGMPGEVAAFLPGPGEETGAEIVASRKIATIVFTGSREVGLDIVRSASDTQSGQEHVKRVIAEMGGKNAIIVDADADLDQAVKGVVYSAFGYAGQKCSACSRVIVVEGIYDRFVGRLSEAVQSLPVGPASDPFNLVGPLIDAEAQERLQKAMKRDGAPLAQAPVSAELEKKGYYAPPTVFEVSDRNDPLMQQEFFGPLLAVFKVASFDEALEVAMDTDYGLTGGVFSRSPEHLQRATRNFRVGNLYLNRGCTGALVGRQPFGGARMSGIGSKAGGPDYLHQFVIPRVVCENTMRQGFAPEIFDAN